MNFRLLVISRFIDLFHDAKDIKLFGWGTDNKVTPDNTKAPSELSGVQCKINGQKVYLNFNSTIGRFEQLSKELEWQTSFETKNAQWYFSSTDPNFNSSLAEFTKPIKLPSQRETEEAILLSDSPQKPRRQPQLRPTLPPKHSKEDTVWLQDGPIVSANFVLNPVNDACLSPRHSDAGWFLPNEGDLSGRSDRLSVDGKVGDRSFSPYPPFATPPQLN